MQCARKQRELLVNSGVPVKLVICAWIWSLLHICDVYIYN